VQIKGVGGVSEIEIRANLGLDTEKAETQISEFRNKVKEEKISVKLDIDNVKGDAYSLKNILADAFKLDGTSLSDLKQVENTLKQINTLIKNQTKLINNSQSENVFETITVNKNTDIVKDVKILVDDYKEATEQLTVLDEYGKVINEVLSDFNKEQKQAFEEFQQNSNSYSVYLDNLVGEDITSALKKAIKYTKEVIELEEEFSKLNVEKIEVANLTNEKADGTIHVNKYETYRALFAESESEAEELENQARKLSTQISNKKKTLEGYFEKLSDDEKAILNLIENEFSARPQLESVDTSNSNIAYIKYVLENFLDDIDKIGLNFNNVDDVFTGVDRFFARLEKLQDEYNRKFASEDGFKVLNLESLINVEDVKKVVEDIDESSNLLEDALKKQYDVIKKDYGENSSISGISERELSLIREYINLSELMSKNTTTSSRKNFTNTINEEQNAIEKLEKSYQKLNDIQKKFENMQTYKGFLDTDLIEKTNNLLSETRSKLDNEGIESDFKAIDNVVRELNNNLKDLNTGNTLSKQEANFNVSMRSMESKVESFIDKCREVGNCDYLIERVEDAFKSIDTSNIERATVDLKEFKNILSQADKEVNELSSSMSTSRTFFGNFTEEFRDNLLTFTAGELLADGIREIGYSLKTLVMEYDTAFTNLKKVANPEDIMSIDQLEAIEKKAVEIAKNVGKSSQETVQAIADTIQMAGLGMEESILVAEQTMKLANVAEMTQEEASEGVVTMLSAFNLDPLKDISIVVDGVTKSTNEMVDAFDKINYVGNNFAVSSDGILQAIQSGANVLASYGVTMDDSIAMITAANTTLQDTSRVGRGLKTLATKLAGVKANASDGTLELNKTAMALKEVAGIDVIKDGTTDEIKDMATLIDELASKWDDLSEYEQSGLSEAIAGAEQAAVFQSLMQNYDIMKEVQEELGSGQHYQSMEQENAQYVDSISGQLNKLKETWVGVFNTIFDSDAAKNIIKGLISISESIALVVEKLDEMGILSPILLGIGALFTNKLFSGFSGISSLLKSFSSGSQAASKSASVVSSALNVLGVGAEGSGLSINSLISILGKFNTTTLALTAGLSVAVLIREKFYKSLDEEESRLKDTINTRKEEITTIESQKSALEEIAKEYDELANKPEKTNTEVERLKELTNEIAQIMPDLVIGYDENGNAIINLTGDVSKLVDELDVALDRKNKLLRYEQSELAENAIKQLHQDSYLPGTKREDSVGGTGSEITELNSIVDEYIENVEELEKKKNKLLGELYESVGDERKKLADEIEDINYKIEQSQSDFTQKYTNQLDIIKEYTKEIGESLFLDIENSNVFKNAADDKKEHFLELKEVLDFSDIKTSDDLFEVEKALSKFLKVANEGLIDIKGVENAIREANSEFDNTGNIDKYNDSMSKLAKEISEISGVDEEILYNLFTQFDTSILNATDSLDKFLNAFGKTRDDLLNDDSFALALASQKKSIDNWIESLNDIGYEKEIDLELAYNIIGDADLPEQIRDMVRVLLNKDYDSTDILRVAQAILIDLSDGEVDIDSIQSLIDRTFGNGAFEVDADILLSTNAKIEGIEEILDKLKGVYKEIPSVVETIIKTDTTTSYSEGKKVLQLYNSFPEKVKTIISNNSYDTLADLELIDEIFNSLSESQAIRITSNCSEVIKESKSLEEVLSRLKTPITITANTESATSVLQSLVRKPISDVIVGIKADSSDVVSKSKTAQDTINSLEQESAIKIEVDNISANNRLKTTKTHLDDLKSKEITVTVKTKGVSSASSAISSLITGGKNRSVDIPTTQNDSLSVQSFEPMVMSAENNDIVSLADEGIATYASSDVSAMDAVTYGVNAFKALEQQLERLTNQLALLSKAADNAIGSQKISYLKQQVTLYEKQQDLQHELAESMRGQASELKSYLIQQGFQIDSEGQVLNYSQKILAIEKEIANLEDRSSADITDSEKKSIESKLESLEKTKDALDEYIDLTMNEIPNCSNTWWELEESIKSVKSQIVSAELAMKNLDASIDVGKYSTSLNSVQREINRLDEDIERAYGEEKQALLEQKIALIQKEQDELHKLANSYRSQASVYKSFLSGYGFAFSSDGTITNLEKIKSLMNVDEYEAIKDALEEYVELTQNTIPDLSEEWWDLQDAIDDCKESIEDITEEVKEAQREQLETTKKVQDQIMELYKKQAEERKELIEEELNKKLDALNKEKQAYNDARDQQKYEDEYNDQLEKIMEIEKQLSVLMLDSSLTGKKKYQELLEELKEEQEKLEEIVQDKIDEDVNNYFDSESDRLEEAAEAAKEKIDEVYSDERLWSMVNSALNSGLFKDINGDLIDLNEAMCDYLDKYGDGLSAIGAIIKDEWLTNIETARDTMNDMYDILENLDLKSIYDYNSYGVSKSGSSESAIATYSSNVEFSSPVIVVEGNVDSGVLSELEKYATRLKNEIIDSIYKAYLT
jgi:TP901 family phage tail tape measure protein